MSLFDVINASSTGMVANRYWLDIVAGNIANANTTRTAEGVPYRRRLPVFQQALTDAMSDDWDPDNMGATIQTAVENNAMDPEMARPRGRGVDIKGSVEDTTPLKVVYQPGHPDADEQGFVSLPNVSVVREMVDMIAAQRAYDANVQVANAAKSMIQKALEIGK
jgi:flagellar basal-body rod protein FlgC